MQEALALVRQELGSQAAVLHTRELRSRGLARLWGGGEYIEVVASDTVSVPGRLPDPYLKSREGLVPQEAVGIDLSEISLPKSEPTTTGSSSRSRVATYLDQGLHPLTAAVERHQPQVHGGAPLLVVSGAKGSGVTSVSWNLAKALAAQGRRAVWADADLSPGPHAIAPAQHEGGLADVLAGRRTIHEVLALGPDGVQCVRRTHSDQQHTFGAADVRRCVRQLTGLAPHAEVIIADVGSEANLLESELWRAASAVCIVVTPDDDAILRGYSRLKRHRDQTPTAGIVTLVNRAEAAEAACVSGRIAQACRQFLEIDVTLAEHLPVRSGSPVGNPLELVAERMWELVDACARNNASNIAGTQNL